MVMVTLATVSRKDTDDALKKIESWKLIVVTIQKSQTQVSCNIQCIAGI